MEEDSALAGYAAETLADEAYGWLSRLGRAEADEEADREVTDRMYAR